MAIIFIDGFDHYVTAEIDRKWTSQSGAAIVSSPVLRAGSKSLEINNSADFASLALPSAMTTIVFGAAFLYTAVPASHDGIVFRNGTTAQVSIAVTATGAIAAYRGTTAGTQLCISAAGVIPINTRVYIEAKVVFHDSTGSVEIRVNGAAVATASGVDTQQVSSGADVFRIGGGSFAHYWDDLFIDDADFKGDCRVDVLMPNGAGATTEWAPSAGSNYQNVDDDGDSDDDTTYNSEDTAGQIDTYTVPDIEATGGAIHAVAVNMAVRKDDVGARTVKGVIRQATTNYSSGTALTVFDSYRVSQAIWATQPDSSGAWDETDLNAAEFGIEMEA